MSWLRKEGFGEGSNGMSLIPGTENRSTVVTLRVTPIVIVDFISSRSLVGPSQGRVLGVSMILTLDSRKDKVSTRPLNL